MTIQLINMGILMFLNSLVPGPDFALVIKNTLFYSKRSGFFTSFGVGAATLIHITYCALGLAIIITQSTLLFNIIKYIGAAYLFYLGSSILLEKKSSAKTSADQNVPSKSISDFSAFKQGLLSNLLNPKAALFFLALFTTVMNKPLSISFKIILALEMAGIITAMYCALTVFLSHPRMQGIFERAEYYIAKILGVFLLTFSVVLVFLKK